MSDFRRYFAARLPCTLALAGAFSITPAMADTSRYLQRNLVADSAGALAENVDPNLVDPRGLAFNPSRFAWLSNRRSGVSTQYDGDGHPQTPAVPVPPGVGSEDSSGKPTGIAWNAGPGFIVRQGEVSGPARFIFASEDGAIAAWAPAVDATRAVRVFPLAFANNALFTGLAIGADGTRPLLYAADFRNNRVDVFDTNFAWIILAGKPFVDPHMEPGYAPFGIQAINGDIYVTYAKQDADPESSRVVPVAGSGLGFVSVFAPDGRFVRRLVSNGALDKPWGLALAPASFGRFSNRLLVANAGDGAINTYDLGSGAFTGRLLGVDGRPIAIDGLWAIGFGNGLANQPVDALFFSAGPGDGSRGLYGRLDVVTPGARKDATEERQ
jgi:uncharacterized protein (TIGR03118 family)